MSLIQFSFSVGAERVIHKKTKLSSSHNHYGKINATLDILFGTEILGIMLTFIVQDFPFMVMRLVIIIGYRLSKNYTLYYQFGKNLILCCLEIYRIGSIFYKKRHTKARVNSSHIDIVEQS
jgi:hypothetical protein